MNNLTLDSVKDIAESLIASAGSTTTLEVKKELRQKGYWAKQSEVSKHMNDIALSEGWNWHDNGTHRTYDKSINTTTTTPSLGYSTSSGSMYSRSTNSKSSSYRSLKKTPRLYPTGNAHVGSGYYQTRDGRRICIATNATGNWEVTNMHSTATYFSADHNRDEVRLAFSKMSNVKIQTVLAHRIK